MNRIWLHDRQSEATLSLVNKEREGKARPRLTVRIPGLDRTALQTGPLRCSVSAGISAGRTSGPRISSPTAYRGMGDMHHGLLVRRTFQGRQGFNQYPLGLFSYHGGEHDDCDLWIYYYRRQSRGLEAVTTCLRGASPTCKAPQQVPHFFGHVALVGQWHFRDERHSPG